MCNTFGTVSPFTYTSYGNWSYPALNAWTWDYRWWNSPAQCSSLPNFTTFCPTTFGAPSAFVSTGCATVGCFPTRGVSGYFSGVVADPIADAGWSGGLGVSVPDQAAINQAQAAAHFRATPGVGAAPDFAASVDAALAGEFSASIFSMRRAAAANAGHLVGSKAAVPKAIAADPELARRVRYAAAIFQNPPQRVVSEADSQFMLAALNAATGDSIGAEKAAAAARSAGDTSASTELLRKAIQDQTKTKGPWISGNKISK